MSTFNARSIPVSRLRLLVPALLLLLGAAILGAPTAHAAGTVTDCSTYGSGAGTLQAALGGGGAITFACSGTIIVPEIAINANTPTVIDATGQDVTLSGNNANRVFVVNSGKSLTLRHITIANGLTPFNGNICPPNCGGGASIEPGATLTVENSTFTDNRSVDGGAIINRGTLVITDSEFSGNFSRSGGAAVASGSPVNDATLTVTGSTFRDNTSGDGGAIGTGGALQLSGAGSTSLVTNTTFSGNQALGTADDGGGAIMVFNGTLTLQNITVANNSSATKGGGISQAGGTVTLNNAIVANNSATGSGPDIAGTITSNDYNLVEDTSGATFTPQTHDLTGVDPLLGPLADNGGDTETHALQPGSPAINAGDTSLTTDQRGVARPQSAGDDIGAFEVACSAFPLDAANEGALNFAIGCYNQQTAAGAYTINITQDVPLTASTIAINNATSGVSLVIEGDGFVVDGQDTAGVRPFEIAANTTVTMNRLTVTNGNTSTSSGGGGIRNFGHLTLSDSSVTSSTGFVSGGGIFGGFGATVTINNSTISGNSVTGGSETGGGIYLETATGIISNSTISGNTANSGGGILNYQSTLTLDSVTITANTANRGAGLNTEFTPAQTVVRNTILAGNLGSDDCYQLNGTVTDGGHNLVQTQASGFNSCGFVNGVNGTILGAAPALGPLADNGGETETHALLVGSPALDAGDTTLTTDQRGVTRPVGAADDIGAYESLCGTATAWTAGTEFELDTAIGCFNKQAVAGSYTITVTANISLTSSIAAINNPTSGPSLVIVGDNHTIDGGDAPGNPGAGGFRIDSPTAVSITDLTVTRSRQLLTGGAIRNVNGGALTLNNVTLTQNRAGFGGGALSSTGPVTITNSVISANTNPAGAGGGGILIESPGSLTLIDSEVSDNTTGVDGGGILNAGTLTVLNSIITGNTASVSGGGIRNDGGSLTVEESTFSGNTAAEGGGLISGNNGNTWVYNSTFSGNTATTDGGGIQVVSGGGTTRLDSVTIANNTAPRGSGIRVAIFGTAVLTNTLIGDNNGSADCEVTFGTISGAYNLVESWSDRCDEMWFGLPNNNNNLVGVDPNLGPLANNGGDTQTHLPQLGSPVINAGATTLTTDQRGEARPQGAGDDIGAVEVVACPASPWDVANEDELNFAIGCYNGQTAPGVYTINVTQNITLTASTTVISNTTAGLQLQILGDGNTVDGQGTASVRPFEVAADTRVNIGNITVTGGNVTSGNVTASGGGILNAGALTVFNSTITGNSASDSGGGIRNDGGSLTVEESTFSGNTANEGGGLISGAGGNTWVYNSTFSGNTATFGGGGIQVVSGGGTTRLDSVTIANNTASTGSGIRVAIFGTAVLTNTLIGDNNGSADCEVTFGTISGAYNLVESWSDRCDEMWFGLPNNNNNLVGVDPNLGLLANNGGPTETHALLAGSPALDAGDTTLATDQRGEPRPFGLADDIGAFELQTCYVDSWSVGNEAELNAAIACYNSKTVAGSYTITVTQGISLTASTTAIDNANSGVSLVIEGSGFAVDGQDLTDVRPFYVQTGTTVTMNDLTATGGNLTGSSVENRGGGILNRGTLSLNRSTVISNTTEARGGGLATQGGTVEIVDSTIAYNVSGTPTRQGNGGGIYNEGGQVTIRNSTISGNESENSGFGGGITNYQNLSLESVTITENGAGEGGGIYFRTTYPATLTIKSTILAGNVTDDCYFETIAGGATINDLGYNLVQADNQLQPCGFVNGVNNNIALPPFLLPLANYGGPTLTHFPGLQSPAIDRGNTSLPTDQRGVARPQGAAADIGAVESTWCSDDSWSVATLGELNAAIACFNGKTIAGSYAITITNGFPAVASTTAIDNSTPGVSLVIEGSGNSVDWNGNLIPGTRPFLIQASTTVTINDLEITNGNVLGTERGGGILNFGNLTLNRCIIRGNRAEFDGGGISNHGVMVINDSTVSGNIIEGGSAPVDGGGIHNEGSLTIRNSTISRNTSSNDGGGIGNVGTLDLDSVTVTANTAQGAVGGGAGAGVFIGASGTLTTRNSILAGNLNAEDCWAANPVTDGGHNLVETQINCGFVNGVNGSIVGQSANLGPLHNNGGPTQTHALLPGSPAINTGDTTLTTDQRGEPRPAGAADDIGAYETQAASITIVKDASPADDTPFDFTFDDGNTSTDFTLSDPSAISQTFTFLPAGVYTVTEATVAGWDLAGVTCVLADGSPAATVPVERGVGITLASIDGVTCTFTNIKLGSLTVVKNTVGGDGTFEFTSQTLTPTLFSLTTVGGTAQRVFDDLLPGVTYDITETVPMGWVLTSATCDDGSPVGAIAIDPGEAVTCTFLNNIQTPTALTLSGLNAAANGPALAWPWLLAVITAALALAVASRRRSRA